MQREETISSRRSASEVLNLAKQGFLGTKRGEKKTDARAGSGPSSHACDSGAAEAIKVPELRCLSANRTAVGENVLHFPHTEKASAGQGSGEAKAVAVHKA